jgi:hypothetical protein
VPLTRREGNGGRKTRLAATAKAFGGKFELRSNIQIDVSALYLLAGAAPAQVEQRGPPAGLGRGGGYAAFLGSLPCDAAGHQRIVFWCIVADRLEKLSNRITAEDRQRIIASIAHKAGEIRGDPDPWRLSCRLGGIARTPWIWARRLATATVSEIGVRITLLVYMVPPSISDLNGAGRGVR